MQNRRLDLIVFALVLLLAGIVNSLFAHGPNSDHVHVEGDIPSTPHVGPRFDLFPPSSPTTKTDDELKQEFLKHTHAHEHHDVAGEVRDLKAQLHDLQQELTALRQLVGVVGDAHFKTRSQIVGLLAWQEKSRKWHDCARRRSEWMFDARTGARPPHALQVCYEE